MKVFKNTHGVEYEVEYIDIDVIESLQFVFHIAELTFKKGEYFTQDILIQLTFNYDKDFGGKLSIGSCCIMNQNEITKEELDKAYLFAELLNEEIKKILDFLANFF